MKTKFYLSLALNFTIILFIIGKRIYYSRTNWSQIESDKKNEWRSDVFRSFPVDSNSIVFVGTSITEGFPVASIWPRARNRGIGGNVASHILNRTPDIISRKPKAIFLEIGANDIYEHISDSIFMKEYRKIIATIKNGSPHTRIYVQSILPTFKIYSTMMPMIKKCNDSLKAFCQRGGIAFLDLTLKMNHENYYYDGIHPTGKGYRILADCIDSVIKQEALQDQ